MSPTDASWPPFLLRVTLFPASPMGREQRPDLGELFKVEVESEQVQGSAKDSTQVASLGVGTVQLAGTLERLDFVWQSPQDGEDGRHTDLGDLDAAIATFVQPIVQWAQAHKWARVAIGALGGVWTGDKKEGYRLLQPRIPELKINPEGSSDLLYQINHLKSVTLSNGDWLVNNIFRWAVVTFQTVSFHIAPNVGSVGNVQTTVLRTQLELDINSAPRPGLELHGDDVVTMFAAFVDLTKNALLKGSNE